MPGRSFDIVVLLVIELHTPYASYAGQWYVEWPIGDAARVRFAAHDSHTLSRDVYPRTFERRVDKCLRMLAGVIDAPAPSSFKCAFPGRTSTGKCILRHAVRGFRHLYHMIGGNVGEVDFLSIERLSEGPTVTRTHVHTLPAQH